ncbi:MAG: histidine phosphatase family protein [Nanoarchaeota archaeon]|nr:histidine phosphatase family protein [Nanoarchaeota archaeon]
MAEKKRGSFSASYIRHSAASYPTYAGIMMSDDPTAPFNPERQVERDLTPDGIKIAQDSARKYFDQLDPKKDKLYMIASNEVRALETAKVYKDEAVSRGFAIISVPKQENDIGYRITKGGVRTSSRLSIDSKNLVADNVFMPADKRFKVNSAKLTPEFRDKYQQALAIVDRDNKGSYGANLVAYGDEVKKVLPEVRTSEQIEKEKLGVLINTFGKYAKRHAEQGSEEDVKVLAFGHQDQMVGFLNREFGNADLKNCEAVSFDFDMGERKVEVSYRGNRKKLEERFMILGALGSLMFSLIGSLYPNLTGFAIAREKLFEVGSFSELWFVVGMILFLSLTIKQIKDK